MFVLILTLVAGSGWELQSSQISVLAKIVAGNSKFERYVPEKNTGKSKTLCYCVSSRSVSLSWDTLTDVMSSEYLYIKKESDWSVRLYF